MEVNSGEKLCKLLISYAFQRCRMLDDLCRLSVSLKPSPPLVRISVSDTGVGSTVEEFHELKYQNDPIFASKWGKMEFFALLQRSIIRDVCSKNSSNFAPRTKRWSPVALLPVRSSFPSINVSYVLTEGISDKEIHHLKFYVKEIGSSRRLVRLPSIPKNGSKFSGTEVSFSISERIDILQSIISTFIRKILVLNVPKIAVELSVDSSDSVGSQSQNIMLQNACNTLPMHAANIDCLKLGIENYVSKHGNRLVEACHCCFSTGDNLKIGAGLASSGGNKGGGQVMEVVIIISETSVPAQSSCSRLYDQKSEVLFFRDFSPSSISQSSLDALTSIEWKKYGLALRSVSAEDGLTLFEWESLPPGVHIDIVLHAYHRQLVIPPGRQNIQMDKSLTRKAVMLALNELKEKNAGFLLSGRAVKICNYAPDLARTLSGLILLSNDSNFQRECLSLLELQSQETKRSVVENCIKDKIVSIVAMNDRKHRTTREAPSLFAEDAYQEPYSPDEEDEGGNEAFEYMDL